LSPPSNVLSFFNFFAISFSICSVCATERVI
jgi:hypothetical protein